MARKGQGVGVRLVMTLSSVLTLTAPSPQGSLLSTCLPFSRLHHLLTVLFPWPLLILSAYLSYHLRETSLSCIPSFPLQHLPR